MKMYPDCDVIKDNTLDFLKRLSVFNEAKLLELDRGISRLETCISEDDYDWFEYSDNAYSLLKAMIKIKLKYKKMEQGGDVPICISPFVSELRRLLILNREYVNFLMEMDHFSAKSGTALAILSVATVLIILAASMYVIF